LQSPFLVDKSGPTQPLLVGQAFNYTINVAFKSTARGVNIIDVLPSEVKASTTANATWFTSKTNTSTGTYEIGTVLSVAR
jgi:hypothetical protein